MSKGNQLVYMVPGKESARHALAILVLSLAGVALFWLAASPVSAQENPMFFGKWVPRISEIARGERFEPQTGDFIVKPGSIFWEHELEFILKAEYEIIKDFGDRVVVKMTTILSEEFSDEEIQIKVLALYSDNQVMRPTFDGRPLVMIGMDECPSYESQEFAAHVLAAGTNEQIWQRILKAPLEKNSPWKMCRMTAEGKWYFGSPSAISGRYLTEEEQHLIESNWDKYVPHWKKLKDRY